MSKHQLRDKADFVDKIEALTAVTFLLACVTQHAHRQGRLLVQHQLLHATIYRVQVLSIDGCIPAREDALHLRIGNNPPPVVRHYPSRGP